MAPTIEQVIAAIPEWTGRHDHGRTIPAGLTNTNFRVEVDGTPYFVRIPGAATELLAVDRGNELHNTARRGRGRRRARVSSRTCPAWDVFVLEWLPGRTMSNETFGAPGMPARIAETLRRLHAGPRSATTSTCSALAERYLALVDERDIAIPAGYREHLDAVPRIEAALAARPLPTVPCHNDLLADNYLDDGTRLWIVDYEYSGNNDPTFELGNTVPGARAMTTVQVDGTVRRLLRRGDAGPAGPDAPADDHVRRRLDAVGGHPGARSRRSTTTSGAGPRSAGRGRAAMLDGRRTSGNGWFASAHP